MRRKHYADPELEIIELDYVDTLSTSAELGEDGGPTLDWGDLGGMEVTP